VADRRKVALAWKGATFPAGRQSKRGRWEVGGEPHHKGNLSNQPCTLLGSSLLRRAWQKRLARIGAPYFLCGAQRNRVILRPRTNGNSKQQRGDTRQLCRKEGTKNVGVHRASMLDFGPRRVCVLPAYSVVKHGNFCVFVTQTCGGVCGLVSSLSMAKP